MGMGTKIWIENMMIESPVLGDSLTKQVTNATGNSGIVYGGGGSGPARAGENNLWDDDDESKWDNL